MSQIKDVSITKTAADDGDFLVLQTPEGETYNIIKSDFLAGLSGGGAVTPAPTEVNLTFVVDGDSNGVLYYIGSLRKTEAWINPINRGVQVSSSAIGSGTVFDLVDRQESAFYCQNVSIAWVKLNLPKSLKCNYYSLRNRNFNGNNLRNWKLQGSNDDTTWVDLDVQENNGSIVQASQWVSLPVTNSQVGYTFFRLLRTGTDSAGDYYLCLGEIELYGVYTT